MGVRADETITERDMGHAPLVGGRRHSTVSTVRIDLVQGDITEQDVNAIVNAANGSLMGGGGVDGAIHRKGGPEIVDECRRIRRETWPDGLPTGEAVATTAGRPAARWGSHTAG